MISSSTIISGPCLPGSSTVSLVYIFLVFGSFFIYSVNKYTKFFSCPQTGQLKFGLVLLNRPKLSNLVGRSVFSLYFMPGMTVFFPVILYLLPEMEKCYPLKTCFVTYFFVFGYKMHIMRRIMFQFLERFFTLLQRNGGGLRQMKADNNPISRC